MLRLRSAPAGRLSLGRLAHAQLAWLRGSEGGERGILGLKALGFGCRGILGLKV